MKNIETILKEMGLEIPEEKTKDLNDSVNSNYKTIAEFTGLSEKLTLEVDKLETANATITDLTSKISDVESKDYASTIETLKGELEDYKQNEIKRTETENAELETKRINDLIQTEVGENQFINEFTKKSIFEEVRKSMNIEENQGKGIKDILSGITKDRTDTYVNPQQNTVIPPKLGENIQIEDTPNSSNFAKNKWNQINY